MTTTLTGKNQITVPAEITSKLGLVVGAQFDWAVGDQPNKITITIKPTRKQLLQRVRQLGRKAKRPGVDEVAEFVKWREADDQLRQDALP
jgi:bifunctional DNA-binding transcriptional regulator/antitoxin component of YhaV-PrlF toxin-antitoxin module